MRSQWSNQVAKTFKKLDLLVYASRAIGSNPELVLWGGGNSSMKDTMLDHVGRKTRVLWIKGSGSDMRTITQKQFTPLRLDELLVLWDRKEMSDESMVAYQTQCVLDLTAPKPSIETLLHAFLPPAHVYHTHADAICTLTDTLDSSKLIHTIYGDDVAVIPYIRPGFLLAKQVGETYRRHPTLRAIILDKHGLVTWGDSPKVAYLETIKMVSEAECFIGGRVRGSSRRRQRREGIRLVGARRFRAVQLLPVLRGAISKYKRMLVTYDDSELVMAFVDDPRAKRLSQIGPFTPDHLIHTKPKPLFLQLPKECTASAIDRIVQKAVVGYEKEYVKYFERYKTPGVTMLDPIPRIILVPGVGLFTTGKDRRAARIAHDLYCHTMRVIFNASAINSYTAISSKEMCNFEYWPMENYKLTLAPSEKELSRRIALVTGAAGAIGRAIAERLVAAGVSVVLTDVNETKLCTLASKLNKQVGEETAVAIPMDVSNEKNVAEAVQKAILVFGGLDIVVSNAGIARSASVDNIQLDDWADSFAVNATGHFLICREAMRIFKRQGIGGNIVVVATKNVLAPGKDFGAYSASKAAQAQLSRILAIEGGEFGVRVNMVNPDGVFEGSDLWSGELRNARAKAYGIRVSDLERYCSERNLLKVRISAQDVAEAVLFFASDRTSKTTGAMLPIDGGVKEAFPR
ncbi:MAG: bifunctional rhamnulose-1-phosphate aldolase/short-chain dehydrogenase [Nitrospiraceae bacterium]|nr:bifunctional rhamnulose-1-phosphate aldolase/short-chain dehydrogenase [Nitrospiraceae bacterium]